MPGIDIRLFAFLHAPEEIEEKNQRGKAEDKSADRHKLVHSLEADKMRILCIIINAAHHSAYAKNMHREKDSVEG